MAKSAAFYKYFIITAVFTCTVFLSAATAETKNGLVFPGAEVVKLASGFAFTEGPAANSRGDVYFTDSHNDHILRWSVEGELSTFRKPSGGAVGLFFARDDNLIVCAGSDKKLLSISPEGATTVLADSSKGYKFNRPNDVFSHPKAGIYFSDPRERHSPANAVSRVFHLSPDHKTLTSAAEDLLYPNGVLVTSDGKTLYVSDWNAKEVYSYTIGKNGALSNRKVFAPEECDGMTLDENGNVYLACVDGVFVYNPKGKRIGLIKVPESCANVCFGGADRKTLFITARTSLYSLRMTIRGGY